MSSLPPFDPEAMSGATVVGHSGFFEDFTVGLRLRHQRGATISDVENNLVTKLVMNTAEGHWNDFAMRNSPLGAGRIVFGLVTASLVFGLTAQDTSEQALAELACTDLRFTGPVHVGDTLYACTEVLRCGPSDERDDAGIVEFHHWGLLDDENVVFEGSRTVLLKRRSHWATQQ
jgi:itaconyl-CoA hydratase